LTFLDVVVLALIQGIGEILPLSANGHLAALPALAHSAEGRLAVSVAAHMGILAALALFFWRDLFVMGRGVWKLMKGKSDPRLRLLSLVLVGSAPAVAVGVAFQTMGGGFGGALAAASAMVVFGLFLLVADRLGMTVSRIEHMSLAAAAGIGLLQAAALIPGVSRTGITVTAARLMGYEREAAARFSLLLAIPLFAGHAGWSLLKLSHQDALVLSSDLVLASAIAGVSALLSIAFLTSWLRRGSFAPFALWRIVFGGAVIAWNLSF
jgi:undecaprenyl-diphosphatase